MTITAEVAAQTLALPSAARTSRRVTGICWFALFAEGYDVGVFGAVLPSLMADPTWRLEPAVAGMIASAVLVGMFFGSYLFGVVADTFGRKPSFVTCLLLFSIASGCAALAPTPTLFALFRAIAGIGIGGIVPICGALTSEYALPNQANRQFGLMYTGLALGIFAAAVVSFLLLDQLGWRVIVGFGALPAAAAPFFIWVLPESIAFLVAKGRTSEATALAEKLGVALPQLRTATNTRESQQGIRALLAPNNRRATSGFLVVYFASMLVIYGLNTWLPQIMRGAGYDLGSSIMFLGVFALSSATGGVLLGAIADRIGLAKVIFGAFASGAAAMLSLSIAWPLPVTYTIVAIAGVGSVSAAVIASSYAANYFPPTLRATALGCFVSFSRFGAICGPMLGGLIAERQLHIAWNFAAFAVAALAAGASILIVPRKATEE